MRTSDKKWKIWGIVSIFLIIALLIGLVSFRLSHNQTIAIGAVEAQSNLCSLKAWGDFIDRMAGKNGTAFSQSLQSELDETFKFDPDNRTDFLRQAELAKRHIARLGFSVANSDVNKFIDDINECKQDWLEGHLEVFDRFNPSSEE